ncbi:unnamed protein product [Oreochromis niloticus]|nr:unnamed protein product [Mustela putorius furo]
MRRAVMSLTAAASGFLVLLSVSAVLGQTGWSVTYTSTHICALKGSTVDIRCSYSYPPIINNVHNTAQERVWFIKDGHKSVLDVNNNPAYTDRVEYIFDENDCTLRITDLRERDSAEYEFRFTTNQPGGSFTGSPGVNLSVTDLKVQVKRSSALTELQCHSSCDITGPPLYVWYHNGQKLKEETSSLRVSVRDDDSSYSCAVKGHEGYRSAAVYAPRFSSVWVSPTEIRDSSSVTLTCSSDANPPAQYSWYKKNTQTALSNEWQLSFSSIQTSDSGEYYCTAENELGRRISESICIDVKYTPKAVIVSASPNVSEINEGGSVTLTCSSDANPPATHTWYKKNGQRHPIKKLIFSSIQSSDSGEYYCRAANTLGWRTSESISIDVKYAPKVVTTSVSPTDEIKEGTSVTLTCSSDANPAANYTWYKENGQRYLSKELVFSSIQASDSGQYYCIAKNKLGLMTPKSISIDVKYAPKVVIVSVSPTGEIKEGTSVTLTCSSDANPPATLTWYKENGRRYLSKELVLSSIQSSHSGEYYCTAVNKVGWRTSESIFIDVKYAPRFLSVWVSPPNEIREGGSATLTCSSDANPAAQYSWYKKNGQTPLSNEWQLSFSSTQPSDSGQYYCTAENKIGKKTSKNISVDVKYAPKLPSVSVSPSAEIVEGSSVTLTCSSDAKPAATYTWYKNQTQLSKEPQLSFSSIQPSDSGEYYCITENKLGTSTPEYISLDVKSAPKPPSVSVSPSAEIVEGSSVTLMCTSNNNSAANYTWYKKNNETQLSKEPQLTLSSIQPSDSGEYYCTAENELGRRTSTFVFIGVKYAPKLPSVSVSPSAEIVEGSSVTLTCNSDANPAAKYTWYKNQTQLSKEPQLTFSSIQPSDSGEYYCIAENKLGTSTPEYISLGVKYAPKLPSVSVSPSAEIVEGSSVTLTCSSDANPAATYSWYKRNNQTPVSKYSQLTFSSIWPSDSGKYYCTAENKLGTSAPKYISVNVTYAPKLPSVSVSPSAEIVEGSSVTLTCSSDANPSASYTWYKKNGQKPLSNERQLSFSSIQPSDSGEYYCTAENELGRSTSTFVFIGVKYAPKLPSVSVSPSAEIVEGSSVTLTCSSDANPAASYTWYKRNNQTPVSKYSQLSFSSIWPSDSGKYYCTAENKLGTSAPKYISVNVTYAPKLPSVSVSPSAEIVEGSSVTLTCSSDANPAANYTWYKEDEDSPKASGQSFTITDFRSEHSGSYFCEVQNTRGRHNSTLKLKAVAGTWTMVSLMVPAILLIILLALVLIFLILWFIASKQQIPEPVERPDDSEELWPTEDDIVYASVHFSKHQADHVYTQIRPSLTKSHRKEKEEEAEMLTFRSASTTPGQISQQINMELSNINHQLPG